MTQRFVLITQPLTPDGDRALAARLTGLGWWHNLPNTWLVVDTAHKLTANALRQFVEDIDPDKHALAMLVEPADWSSRNLNHAAHPEIADWLRKYWYDR